MTNLFRVITSSLLPLMLLLAAVLTVSAQERARVLTVPDMKFSKNGRGIEIIDIQAAGKPVEIGKSFTADDDWLEGLVFKVKNISSKPITRMYMTFSLTDTRIDAKDGTGFSFYYGDWCGSSTKPPCDVKQDYKAVMPGEEVEMKFNRPEQYKAAQALALRLTGVTKFNRVLIGVAVIFFEDGTNTISQDLVAHN